MAEKVRRPRAEVQPVVDAIAEWAESEVGDQWEVGGSWRRGSEVIGDIDVVLFYPTLAAVELPEQFVPERMGGAIAQGDMLGVHVDFWACPRESAGPLLWFITGPKELNVWMRSYAKGLGMKLTQTELQGYDGPVITEEQVSDALGLPYLPPDARNDWRRHYANPRGVAFLGDNSKIYRLTLHGGRVTCTCKGFTYRGACKHSANPAEWIRESREEV
jgi:DNA polymerase/3'-5' exonuclease PolX